MTVIEELRERLRVLAIPAEEQLAWLASARLPVDELALQVDDVLEAALHEHRSPPELAEMLRRIDSLLSAMSGRANARLWSEEALRSDERWSAVRALARDALGLAGWPG